MYQDENLKIHPDFLLKSTDKRKKYIKQQTFAGVQEDFSVHSNSFILMGIKFWGVFCLELTDKESKLPVLGVFKKDVCVFYN